MYCKSIIQHEFNTFLQIRCLKSSDVRSTQRQTCGCKDDQNMNSSLYLVQCNVLQKHHSTRVQHFSPNTLIKISRCSLNPEANLRLQRWSQYELFFVSDSKHCIVKASFNKTKTLFISKLKLNLRKKPVNYYTWSVALYSTETWSLWKADHKYPESSEMQWRRKEGRNISVGPVIREMKYDKESRRRGISYEQWKHGLVSHCVREGC